MLMDKKIRRVILETSTEVVKAQVPSDMLAGLTIKDYADVGYDVGTSLVYQLNKLVSIEKRPSVSISFPKTGKDGFIKYVLEEKYSKRFPKIVKWIKSKFKEYEEDTVTFDVEIIYPSIVNERHCTVYDIKDYDKNKTKITYTENDTKYYALYVNYDDAIHSQPIVRIDDVFEGYELHAKQKLVAKNPMVYSIAEIPYPKYKHIKQYLENLEQNH